MANNYYLTGMMGSGKSVTGKSLAQKLGIAFVDLDENIENETGKKIAEIFMNEGEEYFRRVESEQLKKSCIAGSAVIATGGGIILREENIRHMKGNGKVIYLKGEIETLWNRVKHQKNRPLLNGQEPRKKLEQLFSERQPLYENSCDYSVNSDGKTADAVADEIINLLRENHESHSG